MKLEPRDYQQQAVDALFTCLKNDKESRPVIVLPTGAGKSVVIAMICERLSQYGFRVVILCRTKELVEQNHGALRRMCPHLHATIYCSGLKQKDASGSFVFATAQSIARKPDLLGPRNLILVDEAHQVPANESSQYQKIVAGLNELNGGKDVRLAGLTATPYRMDGGMIAGEGKQFSEIAYEKSIRDMVENNWLVPTINYNVLGVDLSEVPIVAGDYSDHELGQVFGERCIQHAWEIVKIANTDKRKSCIVFASTVVHAEAIVKEIKSRCESVALVTGDTDAATRDKTIDDFRAGEIRFLVNVAVLTTGFDAPNVDMIALCRATQSHGLLYQILGRGMRLCEGKQNCLVLDYGDHESRLGSIYDDDYGVAVDDSSEFVGDDERPEAGPVVIERVCSHCNYNRSDTDVHAMLIDRAKHNGVDVSKFCARWMAEIDEKPRAKLPAELQKMLSVCPGCRKPYAAQLLDSLRARAAANDVKPPKQLSVLMAALNLDQRNGGRFVNVVFTCINDKGKTEIHKSYLHFHGEHAIKDAERKCNVLFPGCTPPKSADDAVELAKTHEIKVPDSLIVESTGRFNVIYVNGQKF